MMMMFGVLRPVLGTSKAKWAERPPNVMKKRSRRWNTIQICPRRDSNTGDSDLWANPLPLGGVLLFLFESTSSECCKKRSRLSPISPFMSAPYSRQQVSRLSEWLSRLEHVASHTKNIQPKCNYPWKHPTNTGILVQFGLDVWSTVF